MSRIDRDSQYTRLLSLYCIKGFVGPEIHKAAEGNSLDSENKEISELRSELDGYIRSIYDREIYKWLPISVQVVARWMEKGKVLRVVTLC